MPDIALTPEERLVVGATSADAAVVLSPGRAFVSWLQPPEPIWSANQRLHHMAKAKKARIWRVSGIAAGEALLAAGFEAEDAVWEVHLSIGVRDSRRRDPHNYSSTCLKAVIDGLVQAGLWPDDNPDHVTTREPAFVKFPKPERKELAVVLSRMPS